MSNRTPFECAKSVYDALTDQYVCTSVRFNRWYKYDVHRWVLIESEKYITNVFRNILPTFDHKVYKECTCLFYDDKFLRKLDANPYLVGFENGIYDLKDQKLRPGTPNDYVSLSTGYDYVDYHLHRDISIDLQHILADLLICKRPSLYLYNYDDLDDLVLLKKGLGGYCGEMPFTILNNNRYYDNSHNLHGKRLVIIEDKPENNDINIRKDIIKNLLDTSDKKVDAKPLYSDIAYDQFTVLLFTRRELIAPRLDLHLLKNLEANEIMPMLIANYLKIIP